MSVDPVSEMLSSADFVGNASAAASTRTVAHVSLKPVTSRNVEQWMAPFGPKGRTEEPFLWPYHILAFFQPEAAQLV